MWFQLLGWKHGQKLWAGSQASPLALQKYGIKFEATIKRKERGNPRFAFLMPWNEFHWLYRYAPANPPFACDLSIRQKPPPCLNLCPF